MQSMLKQVNSTNSGGNFFKFNETEGKCNDVAKIGENYKF